MPRSAYTRPFLPSTSSCPTVMRRAKGGHGKKQRYGIVPVPDRHWLVPSTHGLIKRDHEDPSSPTIRCIIPHVLRWRWPSLSGCINWQRRTPTHQDGSHFEPQLYMHTGEAPFSFLSPLVLSPPFISFRRLRPSRLVIPSLPRIGPPSLQ